MKTLSIDVETFSSENLTKCGVYRYAEAPDFEVLLFGYSADGAPVKIVDLTAGETLPADVRSALTDPAVTKWAFNAQFERVCLSRYLGYPTGQYLDPSSWHCTMVWAATLGLPLSLEGVGAVLGLEKQKLKEGKDLRYGVISGNLDIEEHLNKIGCFTVTFNCKPYKYSFAGQQTVVANTSTLTITNPTAFESKPYIKLYGSGAVALMIQPQGRGMMISDLDEYIEIDSELMNCYKGTVLKNDAVKGAEFPVLKPGACTINCIGDVTRIEVIPRWCCL